MAKGTDSRPSLGVVIPCHNNSWQLRGVLESLHGQTIRPEAVVVVDDNSTPREWSRLRQVCRDFGARSVQLPVPRNRFERMGRRSAARNLGTKHLGTEIVLYLDGDMLLSPTYVETMRYYHAKLDRIYIRGRRYGIPVDHQRMGMQVCMNQVLEQTPPRDIQPLQYIIPPTAFIADLAYSNAHIDRWEWCASNNLSVRTEYVVRIGYWDEDFVGWGEEDIDFSFRLHESGLTPILLLSDDAVSYHLDHPVDHETNTSTLKRNAERLLTKFPQIADHRMEAYARYGIDMEDLAPRRTASLDQ